MIPLCIIGCGISGMCCLLMAQKQNIPPQHICIIDPFFDGGTLQRDWRFVQSNTPWSKLLEAMNLLDSSWRCPAEFQGLNPSQTTPVYYLAKCIYQTILPYLQQCTLLQDTCKGLEKCGTLWSVQCSTKTIQASLILLTTGCHPKPFFSCIPQIPLSIGFHKESLQMYLKPTDTVLVFGTSHSGTLLLENLHKCNVKTIAIYKHKEAFLYNRDGHYDGIKAEAARIADEIQDGKYTKVSLVSLHDTPEFIKAIRSANWVLSAIGFEPNDIFLKEEQTLWKLGAVSPPIAPDGIHRDSSVFVFAEQVLKIFPQILETYKGLEFHSSL
jgi:hypothetical protein